MFSTEIIIKNKTDDFWEYVYQIISKFKNKYNLIVRNISESGSDKIHFSFKTKNDDRYSLYFTERIDWILFDCDTNVDDFSEKYKFLEELYNKSEVV